MNEFITSSDLRNTNRNWAIGAAVAAVTALVGIGVAVSIGGDDANTAVAAPQAPITTPATAATIAPVADNTTAATAAPAIEVAAAPAVTTPAATPTESAPAAQTSPTPSPTPKPKANNGPCPTYRSTNNLPLQLCDKGDWVSDVQALLLRWNDITVDGHFGSQTERAVKYMQGELGFEQNGLVTLELLDLINRIDPSCNANGAMCDQPEEDDPYFSPEHENGYDIDDEQEGPHGDHIDGGYSYDDYCNDVLFDAVHTPALVDIDPQEVANCTEWVNL